MLTSAELQLSSYVFLLVGDTCSRRTPPPANVLTDGDTSGRQILPPANV